MIVLMIGLFKHDELALSSFLWTLLFSLLGVCLTLKSSNNFSCFFELFMSLVVRIIFGLVRKNSPIDLGASFYI